MNLKPMSLNQTSNNKEGNSSKLPNKASDWLKKDAEYIYKTNFAIHKDNFTEALTAVKNSTLPQEVIEYLTQAKDFKSMLTAIGFEFTEESVDADEYLSPCKYKSLLDSHYAFRFMNVIAPFVKRHSFLEFRESSGKICRWVFNGIICCEVEPRIVWEY